MTMLRQAWLAWFFSGLVMAQELYLQKRYRI